MFPSLQSVVCLKGAETTMRWTEVMTVPGEKAVPVGLRPATHLEMRCVLGESVILWGVCWEGWRTDRLLTEPGAPPNQS